MKKELGDKIRIQRISKGLSQENMASELSLSIGAYSNIERGKTDITVTRLYEIADLLQVGIYEFLPTIKPNYKLEDPHFSTADIYEQLKQLRDEIKEIREEKSYEKTGKKKK